ncbi:hypothetical protein KSP40_PGU009465 [Platanthera guangdongensis]|uniref:Uncharacterized protein n=1 Tax=Platanthera guangdongensis TaxID=2320717 RepID=A0ABR2LD40_9ASPA
MFRSPMAMPRSVRKKASNPFDSDSDDEFILKPKRGSSSSTLLENKSAPKLESYAVDVAKKTTQKVKDCLRIAENIKEIATITLVTLHHQGEPINRFHQTAVEIDKDHTKCETFLWIIGEWFSKLWTKSHHIKGSVLTEDNSYLKENEKGEERAKLGLSQEGSKYEHYAEPTSALEKVKIEKWKQDDTLGDISEVLGQLKGIAVDIGTELDRWRSPERKQTSSLRRSVTSTERRASEPKYIVFFLT